jgi:outer membrane lipoprotein-sorting protein
MNIRTLTLSALTCLFTLSFGAFTATAQTADEIVKKMDENMTFKTRTGNATLTVERPGESVDTRSMTIWGRGIDDSYNVFKSPARDAGVKYLKLGKSLHMYLPRSEKVVSISGHLLRESIMDSDFSYEDMLEAHALLADYDTKIVGEETFGGDPCWIVELTAKHDGVSYYRRKLWISKKTYVALKMERYAETGLLLKTMTATNIVEYGGRHYPMKLTMQDSLRKGSKSTFSLENIKFDVTIPDTLFSRRNLMKPD